jgi:hypothetical protein
MTSNHGKNLVKALREVLEQEESIVFCYLFGSRVAGNTNSESDVDLGVLLDKEKVGDLFEKRLELINKISRELKTPADVVILNEASPFLKFVVLKEGEPVLERSKSEKIDFELKSFNEYFDFKPVLEKYNQRLLNS